jgi:hypothetical protein
MLAQVVGHRVYQTVIELKHDSVGWIRFKNLPQPHLNHSDSAVFYAYSSSVFQQAQPPMHRLRAPHLVKRLQRLLLRPRIPGKYSCMALVSGNISARTADSSAPDTCSPHSPSPLSSQDQGKQHCSSSGSTSSASTAKATLDLTLPQTCTNSSLGNWSRTTRGSMGNWVALLYAAGTSSEALVLLNKVFQVQLFLTGEGLVYLGYGAQALRVAMRSQASLMPRDHALKLLDWTHEASAQVEALLQAACASEPAYEELLREPQQPHRPTDAADDTDAACDTSRMRPGYEHRMQHGRMEVQEEAEEVAYAECGLEACALEALEGGAVEGGAVERGAASAWSPSSHPSFHKPQPPQQPEAGVGGSSLQPRCLPYSSQERSQERFLLSDDKCWMSLPYPTDGHANDMPSLPSMAHEDDGNRHMRRLPSMPHHHYLHPLLPPPPPVAQGPIERRPEEMEKDVLSVATLGNLRAPLEACVEKDVSSVAADLPPNLRAPLTPPPPAATSVPAVAALEQVEEGEGTGTGGPQALPLGDTQEVEEGHTLTSRGGPQVSPLGATQRARPQPTPLPSRASMEADEAHAEAEADADAAVGVSGGIGASGEVGGVDGGAEGAGLSMSQAQRLCLALSMSQPQPSLLAPTSMHAEMRSMHVSGSESTIERGSASSIEIGSESSLERGSASVLPQQHPNSTSTFPPAPPPPPPRSSNNNSSSTTTTSTSGGGGGGGGGGGKATEWAEAVSGKRGGRGRRTRESEAESIKYPPTLLEAIGALLPSCYPTLPPVDQQGYV